MLTVADSGEGSLRQAVLDANAQPGADTIRFADALRGTIALTSGQLSITGNLTIDGPGSDRLAVSGNYQTRVLSVSGKVTVAIAGLTIKDGRAVGAHNIGTAGGDGGGILTNLARCEAWRLVRPGARKKCGRFSE